jgi:hypothetical protein
MAIQSIYDEAGALIAEIEAQARLAARSRDHAGHSSFARVAAVFGEFRSGLAPILQV